MHDSVNKSREKSSSIVAAQVGFFLTKDSRTGGGSIGALKKIRERKWNEHSCSVRDRESGPDPRSVGDQRLV
jgi:hypothetical protein